MKTWVTPEEMESRRQRNKVLLYCSLPIIGIALSALVTILVSNL
ncbi:hypothetical protein [Fredinandcohnia sp. 179-A 10B2 NHS]